MNTSRLGLFGLLFVVVGSAGAASQLAPLFKAAAKDPRSAESINPDLFKVIPSEEIPVIADAINSGNPTVMTLAISTATAILRIHKMDGENPNFRQLSPPLPEVIREFQALLPVLDAHFDDEEPEIPGALSKDNYTNTPWKTLVVQFMDLIGAAPTPDMVALMV